MFYVFLGFFLANCWRSCTDDMIHYIAPYWLQKRCVLPLHGSGARLINRLQDPCKTYKTFVRRGVRAPCKTHRACGSV